MNTAANNALLPEACNGVTLEGAISSAIMGNRTGETYKANGKALKEHKTALACFFFGLLAETSRANRIPALEAFAVACEATGDLAKDWRKGSTLATKLSEARTIADTLTTQQYLQVDSFSGALKLARDIKRQREEDADAIVAERELESALRDMHGDRWELERLKLRAKAFVDGLNASIEPLDAYDRELLRNYAAALLQGEEV